MLKIVILKIPESRLRKEEPVRPLGAAPAPRRRPRADRDRPGAQGEPLV